MKIKHLQLNTSMLSDPKAVIEFILKNDIDIACLQEVVYQQGEECPLVELCKAEELNYFEAIHYYHKERNLVVASAIVSKFPIKDFTTLYHNTSDYNPKTISDRDFVGSVLLNDDKIDESMASRGLKHSIKPRAIPIVTLEVEKTQIRVYSLSYTVSSWATETEKMYDLTQLIVSKFTHSKKLPTILSGDLNLQKDSYSVGLLEASFENNSAKLTNTLSDSHRALVSDFPEGLAVDHVFSYGFEHLNTEAIQIEFSDHKALVSEFRLKQA